jgi:hypothetical protein
VTGKEIRPYPHQARTLDSKARYIVMLGGTGGGKTWWGPVWLADRIQKDYAAGVGKGAKYLAIGPTVEMVRDTMVPYLRDHYAGTYLQGAYKEQKNIYELPTGGRIYFRSADKPQRIEGHHVRAAWVDEPGQMKALIWPIIKSRTAFHRAPVLLTGLPVGHELVLSRGLQALGTGRSRLRRDTVPEHRQSRVPTRGVREGQGHAS